MPRIAPEAKTVRVELTCYGTEDPAWIEIKSGLTVGDIAQIFDTETQYEQRLAALAASIAAWNFTDEQGNPEPVTVDNIKKLRVEAIAEIQAATSGLQGQGGLEPLKKDGSSSTSPTR